MERESKGATILEAVSKSQLAPAPLANGQELTTNDQRRTTNDHHMSTPTIVEVQNRNLSLTNLDKILYPAAGFTKGQVVDFYVRIAPVLLPHLAGRALTMKRYPGGVGDDQEYFSKKNPPSIGPTG